MTPHPHPDGDLLAAETELKYKCKQCGNMFAAALETCDYCGYRCEPNACVTLYASTEDY